MRVLTPMTALLVLGSVACTSGPFAPGCDRQTGSLIEATATVAATATMSYEVTSPPGQFESAYHCLLEQFFC